MAEERAVIAKECALIRTAFKDDRKSDCRHRNVAKLMYVDMLGYPTHFGQMEVLKLIAAPSFSEKRVGYLALGVLLDERTEVLMLVTQSLKNDLHHSNPYIVGLALSALGNVASDDISRDLAREIEKLMRNSNPYIRKKATLCAIRMLRKVPELLEEFMHCSLNLLEDKSHGPLLGAVSLISYIVDLDRKVKRKVRKHVPKLISTLRQLVLSSYDPDHDIAGVTDPFLQVKIICLLRKLASDHTSTSDEINDVLAQVATNTESTKNPGNAILYECVQTIMSVEAEASLRVLAINILGRFLINRDNNIRYVALNTLCKAERVDAQAIQRHRNTIVDCLKDVDPSIRKRALDLVYILVNKSNVRALVRELLSFLALSSSDVEFKAQLTDKICIVVERYSPNKYWHVQTIIKVLEVAGNLVQERTASNLIVLVMNEPEIHSYAVYKLYNSLVECTSQASLVRVATWCIGEFGEYLVSKDGADAATYKDQRFSQIEESDVTNLFNRILKMHDCPAKTRGYILTACLKLTGRFSDDSGEIREIISSHSDHISLELQQRSCEYDCLDKHENDEIRKKVVGPMPSVRTETIESDESSAETPESGENSQESDGYESDLDAEDRAISKKTAKSKKRNDVIPSKTDIQLQNNDTSDLLPLDIFDAVPASASSASNDLLSDLFQMNNVNNNAPQNNTLSGVSDFGDLDFMTLNGPQSKGKSVVVFQKDGLTLTFEVEPGNSSGTFNIVAHFHNSLALDMSNMTLQVAVPKFWQQYITLDLSPASGSSLLANSSDLTQKISIANTFHGTKQVLMRLKIVFEVGGETKTHQTQLDNFPEF
eukprot:290950_1